MATPVFSVASCTIVEMEHFPHASNPFILSSPFTKFFPALCLLFYLKCDFLIDTFIILCWPKILFQVFQKPERTFWPVQ